MLGQEIRPHFKSTLYVSIGLNVAQFLKPDTDLVSA